MVLQAEKECRIGGNFAARVKHKRHLFLKPSPSPLSSRGPSAMSTFYRNNAPPPAPAGDGPKFRRREKKSFGPTKPKVEPFAQCNSELFAKLENVKKIGALRQSLAPTDGSSEFEILEFYGDSVLYERISFFLMQTRRFMSPHLLTRMRMSVINNRNLANVYDVLGLQNLISSPETVNVVKSKADVVEAIVGELSESAYRSAGGTAALVRTVLDELLAYVCYLGEQTYFAEESREKAAEASKAQPVPQASVAPVRLLSATPALAAASSSANPLPLPPPPPVLEPVQHLPAPAPASLSPVPVTPAPRQPEGRRTPRRPRSRSGSSNASSSPSPSPPRRSSPPLPPPPPPPTLPVVHEEPPVSMQFQRLTLGGREVREYRV